MLGDLPRILRTVARFLIWTNRPTEWLAPVIIQQTATPVARLKKEGYHSCWSNKIFRFAARRDLTILSNMARSSTVRERRAASQYGTLHTYLVVLKTKRKIP